MNERIREFADQILPNEKEFHQGDPKDWGYFFSGEELEKFAELIVRECIKNIRDNMEHARVWTDGDPDLFLETLRKSGHFYITELEQHFGVE